MFNPNIYKLIPATVSLIEELGGFTTKTKLLKILYLFDVEYYRKYRRIYTGFNWLYYHLGPWTHEYDRVLEDLVAQSILYRSPHSNPELDVEFYRTSRIMDIRDALPSATDEYILRRIVNIWADIKTAQILDYVYFHTEPILQGTRNEPLDFSVIPEQSVPRYIRSSSGETKQEIKKAREAFEAQQKERTSVLLQPPVQPATPPNYDDEYWEAIETLEGLAR